MSFKPFSNYHPSITVKVLILALITATLGLSLTSRQFLNSSQIIKKYNAEEIDLFADVKAEQVNSLLGQYQNVALRISQEPELVKYLSEPSSDSFTSKNEDPTYCPVAGSHWFDELTRQRKIYTEIRGFKIVNSQGEIIISIDSQGKTIVSIDTQNLNQKDQVKKDKQLQPNQTKITDVYYDPHLKENVFSILAPLYEGSNYLGYIKIQISPDSLYQIFLTKHLTWKLGEMYLIDQNNYMISPSRFKKDVVLKQKVAPNTYKQCQIDTNLLSNKKIHTPYPIYKHFSYYNLPVLSTYRFIPGPNWCLVSEVSEWESQGQNINSLLVFNLSEGLGVLGLVFGVFLFMHLKIAKPIKRLSALVTEMEQGNYGQKIEIKGGDEIAVLGKSFNQVSQKLNKLMLDYKHRISAGEQALARSLTELKKKHKELQKSKETIDKAFEQSELLRKELKLEKANVEHKVEEKTLELQKKTIALKKANQTISEGWLIIQKEKAKLMSSIDNLNVGFVLTDANDKITITNKAIGRILGYESKLSIEQKLNKLFNLKKHCQVCRETKQNFGPQEIQLGDKYLQITATPVLTGETGDNQVAGTVILIEDITERKNLEKSKGEFFAMATHELRTPLTAIKGNADMLKLMYKDKVKDKDFNEMVNDIYLSSERLIRLVGDILDMSKLEMNKMQFQIKDFHIKTVIDQAIKELTTNAKYKKLYLKSEISPNLPLVHADQDRVLQVLANLIGNAIKFTDTGGITVRARQEADKVKIQVVDTGIGISMENQNQIFKKFHQLQTGKKSLVKGTGLGLYISKLMVENMGGKIGVESSSPGKGSVFSFTLPSKK